MAKKLINTKFLIIFSGLVFILYLTLIPGVYSASQAPTVNLITDRSSVREGESITLSWSSSNANSCVAYSGWFGVRMTSGSEVVRPTETTTYNINCFSDSGLLANDSITITVGNLISSSAPTATVSVQGTPQVIKKGESAIVSWGTSRVSNCNAFGGWSGAKPLSGVEAVSPDKTANFGIICGGEGGVASSETTIQVVGTLNQPRVAPIVGQITPTPKKTILLAVTRLPSPTNLSPNNKVFPEKTKSVELNWDKVEGAKGYAVRADIVEGTDLRDSRNNCQGNPHYLCVNGHKETSISLKVDEGRTYNWWIHAVGSNGEFSDSAFASFSVAAKLAKERSLFASIFLTDKDNLSGWGILILVTLAVIIIFLITSLAREKREKEELLARR